MCSYLSYLVGLVVKASASRTEDPGFESRLRWDFSGSSHTNDQWLPFRAPGIIGSVLGLVGPVSVYCDWVRWKVGSATSISVLQHVKLSEQIRPWDTLACCWDVKQPTNKLLPLATPNIAPQTFLPSLHLFCSSLDCILHLEGVALCQFFTVLCCPYLFCSLLSQGVISSTMFWSSNWSYVFYFFIFLKKICCSVLPMDNLLSFIQPFCPAHFNFSFVMYSTMSVTLVLPLMMVLQVLSFSPTVSIFLSIACWLVST